MTVTKVITRVDIRAWFREWGFPKVAIYTHVLFPGLVHVYLPRRLKKWDYEFMMSQLREVVVVGLDVRVYCGFFRWLWYGYIERGF
jgi:hypothetical protein